MIRTILAVLAWLSPAAALAQSSPNLAFGQVPTSAQWNSFFAAKQDFLGVAPLPLSGGTLTGKLTLAPSTTAAAGLNCGAGAVPTTPTDGDFWCTSTGVFARINGTTVALGTSGGTVPVTQGGTGRTTFTANLPLIGNGTGALNQGTRSGNTTVFATVTGATPNGSCVAFDASGNLVNAGVGACGGTGGAGTVASATIGQLAIYTAATTVAGLTNCANGYIGTNGSSVVSCATTLNSTLSASITSVGTVTSGTWSATVVSPAFGGTGTANGANTIALGGNLATTGGAITLTAIGATNITLPTSGTLMTQTGTSGGVPYFNTATTAQSSGVLAANAPVLGGGAGTAPFSGTRQGNTTAFTTYTGSAPVNNNCAAFDASGNIKDSGQACGTAAAAPVLLATLTASASASLTDVGNCGTGGSAGCFTATYPNYLIVLQNIVATAPGTNVGCQIHVFEGGSYQTSGYLGFFGGSTTATYLPCALVNSTSGANSLAAPGVSGTYYVFNPSASAKAQWVGNVAVATGGGSGAVTANNAGGWWNTSGVVTGFRVCLGTSPGTCAGTIATGLVKIYGLP